MYGMIKAAAASLLMPLPVLAAVFVLGLVFLRGRSRTAVCGLAVSGVLLLSWAPVADRMVATLEGRYLPLSEVGAETEMAAVVVLGGGWNPLAPGPASLRLSDSSALRLMEGVRLWRQRPELPLVVTGRSRNLEEASIASGMASAAMDLGVPPERIVRLDAPMDTGQEARAVAEYFEPGTRIVLVTTASHMPRAMAHFERAGLRPLAAPTQWMADRDRVDSFRYWIPAGYHLIRSERAIYEWLGLIALRWEASSSDDIAAHGPR